MTHDSLLRTLPLAFALTLLALTGLWGVWMLSSGAGVIGVLSAAATVAWPPLALAAWRSSRSKAQQRRWLPDPERQAGRECGAQIPGLLDG